MIKKYIFSLGVVLASLSSFAQVDDTYNYGSKGSNSTELSEDMLGELMVIPFDLRFYYSYFDKHFVRENNLSVEEIRERFRIGLNKKIAEAASAQKKPTSPYKEGGFNMPELAVIYNSLSYKKANVPVKEEDKTKVQKLTDKWKKKFKKNDSKKKEKTGTYIKNGQIVTVRDNNEKYMKAEVKNEDFLFVLNKKYTSEIFILVNQLEIMFPIQIAQTSIQSGHYPREIRVHYTILDKSGKEIGGGLVKEQFPSTLNNIEKIIEEHFTTIANTIVKELPIEEEEETKQ